jgi:hypothetical protein
MSNKQAAFVEFYLQYWNATKAAELAGYAHPRQAGSRLLSNVDIRAAIKVRLEEITLSADEVLVRLAEQARFDPLRFVDTGKSDEVKIDLVKIDLVKIREAGLGSCVKKIAYDRHGYLVVEFHDSQAALRLIGQHRGLFANRNLNFDMSKLSDEQLQRIAAGEDPIEVIT